MIWHTDEKLFKGLEPVYVGSGYLLFNEGIWDISSIVLID